MAWLSRLPKRRVVSGLDLDDAVPPVPPNAPQDLAQNALDLTCEESATPRRKRLRRRLLEEKENVIFEPERSVEGCPTAASSRTEESMRISERPRSQDVEPVPRRRLLRHSISEESVIFPDRPDEPTLTGRRRLRQSISEESLIFPERLPQLEVQQNLQPVEALEPRSTSTSGTPTPCPTASTASRLPQRRAVVVPDLEEPRRSASEATVSRPATFASLELEEAPSPPRASNGPNPNRVRPSLRPIEVEESQPDPPDLQEISEDSDAESPPPPPIEEVQRWNRRGRQLRGFEARTDEGLARLLQERERAFASNRPRPWHLEHLEARPWHLRALELLSQEATRAAQANALAALAGRFPGRPARPPWPPGPGGRARGGGARWQHLEGRELTADDYETLLQLDSAGPSVSSDDQAVEVQRLISMLPCSKLPAGARSRECMICLDQMEAGHEVRTLPCMHVFHSECIDKWFRTSERRPICPIDKEEVQVD